MHPQGRYSLRIIWGLNSQPGSPIANRLAGRLREWAAAIVPLRCACKGIARTAAPRYSRPAGSALHLDNARYAGERLVGFHEAQN